MFSVVSMLAKMLVANSAEEVTPLDVLHDGLGSILVSHNPPELLGVYYAGSIPSVTAKCDSKSKTRVRKIVQ